MSQTIMMYWSSLLLLMALSGLTILKKGAADNNTEWCQTQSISFPINSTFALALKKYFSDVWHIIHYTISELEFLNCHCWTCKRHELPLPYYFSKQDAWIGLPISSFIISCNIPLKPNNLSASYLAWILSFKSNQSWFWFTIYQHPTSSIEYFEELLHEKNFKKNVSLYFCYFIIHLSVSSCFCFFKRK